MISPTELWKELIYLRDLAVQCGGSDWFIREEVSKLVEIIPSASTVVFDPSKYIFSLNEVILPVVNVYSEPTWYNSSEPAAQFLLSFNKLNEELTLMDTAWRLVGAEVLAE